MLKGQKLTDSQIAQIRAGVLHCERARFPDQSISVGVKTTTDGNGLIEVRITRIRGATDE